MYHFPANMSVKFMSCAVLPTCQLTVNMEVYSLVSDVSCT